MKRVHLLLLLVAAGILVVGLVSLGNSESYATFQEAESSPDKTFHVAGTLALDKPMVYQPEQNANLFTFYMIDREGTQREVWLNAPKPADFDRSEQVVVIGKSQNQRFMAAKVLTKCPSKYNETETQKAAMK
jgi:cytochrome c-type biogenesis protein CcmE